MIYRSPSVNQSCCHTFKRGMSLTCVPYNGCLIEIYQGHGECYVVVSVSTEFCVSDEHENVGNEIGDTGPHADLVEHLSNNTEKYIELDYNF